MKFAKRLRVAPQTVWIVPAIGVVTAVIVVATWLTISAHNATMAQAAADQTYAQQAAADAAIEISDAQGSADYWVTHGEELYAESAPWSSENDRASLRDALDELIEVRSDESSTAAALESATREVTRATTVIGSPPAPVALNCGNLDAGVTYSRRLLVLHPDGSGQFDELWAAQVGCDTGMSGGSGIRKSVAVQTPLQRAAVAAAKEAGYGNSLDSDGAILYAVYDGCAESGSGSYYSGATALSAAQAKEVEAWLTLCPGHPDAAQWRAAAGVGAAQQEAESSGARVPPSGTYAVPVQMTTGIFVAENVTNCYWETRDSNGNIIDNNFVVAAPRVVAEVTGDAAVFTSQGACGYWNRQ